MDGTAGGIHSLRNPSPRLVTVRGRTHSIVLPPLGEHQFDDPAAWADLDLAALRSSPYLEVDTGQAEKADLAALAGVGLWIAVIGTFIIAGNTDHWLPVVGWIAMCVAAAIVTWVSSRLASWTAVGRWAREKVALVLVLTIGFGIPAGVLLVATEIFDRLRRDAGAALDAPLNQVIVYRSLQVLFLGIAATFPALLYFLFDRQNVETLRSRFLLALFRLDSRLDTAADWRARYGRQVAEAFGKPSGNAAIRLLRARRSPVVVATIVLSLGWVLAFLNLDAVSLGRAAGDVLAGGSLLGLFEPERGVIAFGFLGAYFFGVNTVLRSYLRGDLRPKAYSQITTRVLIVVVLSSLIAITSLGDEAVVLAIAFFAGIVPDTVLQWIWEQVRARSGERFDELQPLTRLEGIDLYDRARLAEEGVTNVESLAHGDLVDLLLQTRIPPGRIVDWVDQAVLHLHLDRPGDAAADAAVAREDLRASLRALGVRTATDLLTLVEADRETVVVALDAENDVRRQAHLDVLARTLRDAEWVEQLLDWRTNAVPTTVVIDAPAPVPAAVIEPGPAPVEAPPVQLATG